MINWQTGSVSTPLTPFRDGGTNPYPVIPAKAGMTKMRSVAVGRAEREEGAIRPRILDAARNRRMREQPRAIGAQILVPLGDRMHPVGIEKRWRRRAIGQREAVGAG